ncbi:hypothetical protein [Kutzneria sp. CA-103260]|nr:hypothetical protein [Kutzneria sp. CA-103260]QUQ64395.1 hypothetical protein JJ691_21150 [Kutzneria sp. CA-103260]
MWAPLSFGLLMGAAGGVSAGRVGLGVFFAVLLVILLAFTALRSRRSA